MTSLDAEALLAHMRRRRARLTQAVGAASGDERIRLAGKLEGLCLGIGYVEEEERLAAGRPLPIHRTEAGYPRCSTCDGGGCLDCTDPA